MEQRTLIAEVITDPQERIDFLPTVAGRWFAQFEDVVYRMASGMIENYSGGMWRFIRVSDDDGNFVTGFMHPDFDQDVTFHSMNGSVEEIPARHAGLCITLTALSHLSFAIHEKEGQLSDAGQLVSMQYHALREYWLEWEKLNLISEGYSVADAEEIIIRMVRVLD